MTYTDVTTFLSELTYTQAIPMILACTMCIIATWTMLTYIFNRLIDSAKDQNKKLLDNMNRLDKNITNQKLTKIK